MIKENDSSTAHPLRTRWLLRVIFWRPENVRTLREYLRIGYLFYFRLEWRVLTYLVSKATSRMQRLSDVLAIQQDATEVMYQAQVQTGYLMKRNSGKPMPQFCPVMASFSFDPWFGLN